MVEILLHKLTDPVAYERLEGVAIGLGPIAEQIVDLFSRNLTGLPVV